MASKGVLARVGDRLGWGGVGRDLAQNPGVMVSKTGGGQRPLPSLF